MSLFGKLLLILLVLQNQDNKSIKDQIKEDKSPVVIKAKNLKIENQSRKATFSEDVVATKSDMVMTCNTLVAYYNESGNIDKFDCIGDVYLKRKEKQATSRKATFDNKKEIITMTGSPYYTDGENKFWGEIVEYDIGKDEVNVKNIKAVVRVKDEKRRESK